MGAKFAPSLANLFMAQWEEEAIIHGNWPELIIWKRFIDDAIFLWKGTSDRLESFLSSLDQNNFGIKFTRNPGGKHT